MTDPAPTVAAPVRRPASDRARGRPSSSSPTIEYGELWPLLVVFGVACLGVLVEAFLPRGVRYIAQFVLALVASSRPWSARVLVAHDLDRRAATAPPAA